jgi:hypothetical protein
MDRMQATPRNAFFGLLSDLASGTVGYMQDPRRTQQMQGLGAMLESTRIPSLLEGLSYGDSMTTGSGMTMRPNEDVRGLIELATAFAPAGKPAAAAAKAGTMALGRAGERMAERVVPQVMERGGLPAQLLTDLAQGSRSQIFIGPEAKTWDQKAAIKAANMERKGATPQEIWSETGTARGPDKMWRQEISDKASEYDPGALEDLRSLDDFDYLKQTQPLGGTLEHKELYKAYPELSDMPVHFFPEAKMKGAYAAYSPKRDRMTLSDALSPEGARSGSLHEIQHAIQERERFGVGGNSRDFARMRQEADAKIGDMNKQMSALVRQMDNPETTAAQKTALQAQYNDLLNQRSQLVPMSQLDPMEAYGHLMGEAEARLTQRRRDLTPEERRQNFPFQYTGKTGLGFDVDPAKMILMTPEGSILERGLLGNIGR